MKNFSKLFFFIGVLLFVQPLFATDLTITKEVLFDFVKPGDTVEYAIKVSNPTSVTAINVVVTDVLPNDLTFDQVRCGVGTSSVFGAIINCTLGELAPGKEVLINIEAKLNDGVPFGQEVVNEVTVTADNEINPSNNTAQVTITSAQVTEGSQDEAAGGCSLIHK